MLNNKYYYSNELAMDINKMTFDDWQIRIFNGRSSIRAYKNTMTGFHCAEFPGAFLFRNSYDYEFRLRFRDLASGNTIHDFVPQMWHNREAGVTSKEGYDEQDPLGCNFRPGSYYLIVPQKETWYPNCFYRSGVFRKNFKGQELFFSIRTHTTLSRIEDAIFMRVEIENKSDQVLDLEIETIQIIREGAYYLTHEEIVRQKTLVTPFITKLGEKTVAKVSSSLPKTAKGFNFSVTSKSTSHFYLRIDFAPSDMPESFSADLALDFNRALDSMEERLVEYYQKLPKLTTSSKQLNDLYKRGVFTFLGCEWNHEKFIYHPYYAAGTWLISTIWDTTYAREIFYKLAPVDFKSTIIKHLEYSEKLHSYLNWDGSHYEIFYIQDLFAYKELLQKYLDMTGDYTILEYYLKNYKKTIFEFLYDHVMKLRTDYGNETELIDLGENTEILIEIRTDGYKGIVPVVNIHLCELYQTLKLWSEHITTNRDCSKLLTIFKTMQNSIQQKLWDQETGWYRNASHDNLFSELVWTFHLYDILQLKNVPFENKHKMIEHLVPGSFLGRFGVFSIAQRDASHFDIIDADWGGGGQYPGATFRIITFLFNLGYSDLAYNILERIAGYTEFFPYLPQNPRVDHPLQDASSMHLQLSATAVYESIINGLFGVVETKDFVTIKPCYNGSIENLQLDNLKIASYVLSIELGPEAYVVRDKNLGELCRNFYGMSFQLRKKKEE